MSSIIDIKARKNYPVFESNQVLTSGQLNQMFDYLDQQNRQTRSRLIGIGIVCGLEVSYDSENNELTISDGIGITTEGFLIHLCDCTMTHYRPYEMPEGVEYLPFGNEDSGSFQQDVVLHELLTRVPAGDDSVMLINDPGTFLNDKYVLLFLECFDRDFKSCLGKNCDETGKERIFTLRKLVINQSDLDTVLTRSDNVGTFFPGKFGLPKLHIAKPRLLSGGAECNAYVDLVNAYRDTLRPTYDELFGVGETSGDILAETYRVFEPLLGPVYDFRNPFVEDPAIISQKQTWLSYLQNPDTEDQVYLFGIQYFKGFLSDLLDTYHLFREKSLRLMEDCCPRTSFQLHLMLGSALPDTLTRERDVCRSFDYRHGFSAPEIYNSQKQLKEEVIHLHKRLVLLCEKFDLDRLRNVETLVESPIKITPDRETYASATDQTIPYYYEINTPGVADGVTGLSLEEAWDVSVRRETCGVTGAKILAYDNNTVTVDPGNPGAPVPTNGWLSTPLSYDHGSFTWLRVEGHLGKSQATVVDHLDLFRSKFNLPIEVLPVKISPDSSDLQLDPCQWEHLDADYRLLRTAMLDVVQCTWGKLRQWVSNFDALLESQDPGCKVSDLQELLVSLRDKVETGDVPELEVGFAEFLPMALAAFDTSAFMESYQTWERQVIDCKLQLMYLRSLIIHERVDVMNATLFHTLEQQLTELIWGLDMSLKNDTSIQLLSLSHYFESYREYLFRRHQEIFCNFLEQHPGIEHVGSVPKGGTLVIVAREQGLSVGEATNTWPVVADFFLPYSCCDTCPTTSLDDLEVPAMDPIARPDCIILEVGESIVVNVLGNDYEESGTRLRLGGLDPEEGGIEAEIISGDERDTLFVTSSGDVGSFQLTYQVVNEVTEQTSAGLLQVLVVPRFAPHVRAVNDLAATATGVPLIIDITTNDNNYDTTDIRLLSTSSDVLGAALSLNGSQIVYEVPYGRHGKDTFSYELIDEERGERSSAQVSVVVYCCHETDVRWVCKNGIGRFFIALDEGDRLDVIEGPQQGELVVEGAIEYTPNEEFVGTDRLTYVITNSSGPTYFEMTILVTDSIRTEVRTVLRNDSTDIILSPAIPLEVFEVQEPQNGNIEIIDESQGAIAYTPEPDFVGHDALQFVFQPEGGNRCTGRLFLSVVCDCEEQDVFLVTGRVTDEGGNPLFGVSVRDNLGNQVFTNDPGQYGINTAQDATLTFDLAGFDRRTEPVNGRQQIDVVLRRSGVDVRGTVFDARSEERLSGVLVNEINTGNQTLTNAEGDYTLRAVPSGGLLQFQLDGYQPLQEGIAGRTVVDVALIPLSNEPSFVTGTVTANGDPLPGVSINVEGTTIGATTDFGGNYRINVPPNSFLLFRFPGFEPVREEVGGRQVIDVDFG
ncbi:MAG: carboxypeptidase-like regulatory domain-containing protein [Bacteroidota bacterium]